jgi:ketosteroid isomerase-like protein
MTATAVSTEATLALIKRFEDSFNRYDVDALMADMTEDCVYEHVAPDIAGGGRYEGQAAVRAVWAALTDVFPNYRLMTEDIFAVGDRCAYRWRGDFDLPEGGRGEIRGVDIFTVREGKIAEKLTYLTL